MNSRGVRCLGQHAALLKTHQTGAGMGGTLPVHVELPLNKGHGGEVHMYEMETVFNGDTPSGHAKWVPWLGSGG